MSALLVLLPFFATTHEPDLTNIERLADSLYAYGSFDAAALEYKRSIYLSSFDTTGSVDSLLTRLKLSLALYRNNERNEADAILYSLEGPMVRMARAVLLIEEGNPYLAARAVDSATCAVFGASAYRLRGWAYLEAKEFTRSASEFRKAGEDSLAMLVEDLKNLRLKNPRTARLLSILPGLGEAYAGRPLFGLWAFLVNAGDTYLIVNSLIKRRYIDALLVYTFLWQRFYAGSMANADRFARDWNERAYKDALDPIRERYGEREVLRLDLAALARLSAP
ncbi:MAG: hypothetical protein E3J71_02435 [Candidatus Stahlbacteria bacterium]|nr:MAG: hypothetical protein E3J71_02435 [Candidatus Stahlbacteria bacterium]